MLEILRNATAGLLEAPEQTLNLTGQALESVGELLQSMSDRIDELERIIKGEQPVGGAVPEEEQG